MKISIKSKLKISRQPYESRIRCWCNTIVARTRQLLVQLFREKIHVSWLIVTVCGGFLLGAGLAVLPKTGAFANTFWLVVALVILILIFASRLKIMLIFAIIAGMILGLWRGTLTRVDLNIYHDWIGQNVVVRGVVSEDPDFGSGGDMRMKLANPEIILQGDLAKLTDENTVNIDDYFTPLPGQIWVSALAKNTAVNRSDVVEISGKLKIGFGTFAATISYGNLSGVTKIAGSDPARELRDAFGDKLRGVIPTPAADLGMGILAGQKTALPAELSAAFIAASLTHIVVASGYNLTILVRFARRLFAKISRFAALGFGGLLVFAFACVTGFSPSMTRASLVAGLSLLAWYYGRKFHPIALLTIVAAITVAIDPTSIWGDAGWWMSFLSFAGVIILAPLIKSYFWGDKPDLRDKPTLSQRFREKIPFSKLKSSRKKEKNFGEKSHPIRQIFLETLSAQIMAAPIIALFMGQFSPYGLIANLLVLWLLPLAMLLTFIAGIAAFILPHFLAQIIAWPATFLLNYVIGVSRWVADLPGASQTVNFGFWLTVGVFAIILLAIIFLKWKTKYNFRDSNVID